MKKVGYFTKLIAVFLFASIFGLLFESKVAHADVAGGGAFAAGVMLGAFLLVGAIIAVVALICFLVIRAIAKKNDDK